MTATNATITITGQGGRPLRPLIEAAIQREIELLGIGVRRGEQRVAAFEQQHGLTSDEFLRRVQNDELVETHDTIEWIGELQMRERLRDKATTLRGLHSAD